MIIYEVNCLVDDEIADDYREWQKGHVAQMLGEEGFESAEIMNLVDDDRLVERPFSQGISVRYRVKNQQALDHYLNQRASMFWQQRSDRFGKQCAVYRRVLKE
ncbi:DUF4286 family protein [Endozoicomonas ascidiicola]|uniref:DUF4286 family protein n=1 Tax=Endozoicomonas ascidiicola TaxID=1698521 RepID=UPI00082CC857|nr:DUF4286 family protein [Endozoicomonas ascidiicola]